MEEYMIIIRRAKMLRRIGFSSLWTLPIFLVIVNKLKGFPVRSVVTRFQAYTASLCSHRTRRPPKIRSNGVGDKGSNSDTTLSSVRLVHQHSAALHCSVLRYRDAGAPNRLTMQRWRSSKGAARSINPFIPVGVKQARCVKISAVLRFPFGRP